MSVIQEVPMMTPSIVNSTTGGGSDMLGMGGGLVGGLVLGSLFNKQTDAVNSIGVNQAVQTGTLTTEIAALGNSINQGFSGLSTQMCGEGRQSDANLFSAFSNLNSQISNEGRQSDANLFNATTNINSSLCSLGHDMANGFANTNFNMAILDKDIQLQNQTNTCAILNKICEDGAVTRALINENTINGLRDELAAERRNHDTHITSSYMNNMQIMINNLSNNVSNGGGGNNPNKP